MTPQQPGVEPIGDEALALIIEQIEHAWGEGYDDVEMPTADAKRLIARLRAAEANQRILIAALRGSLQAQDRDPGDPTFDAAVAQLLEPGQPIPEPPAAEAAQQWRPIDTAPRDGTPILVAMRHDIAAADDWRWAGWNGRYVVVRHDGVMDGHYDMGWSVAAPVGQGGLPDSWMLGWMPLPPPPEPRT